VSAAGAPSRRAAAAYRLLFAAETAGLVLLLSVGVPLYRLLQLGPGGDRPGDPLHGVILIAIALMQVCYWTKRRFAPAVRAGHSVLAGHLLLFLSRLTFVLVGSYASLVFLVRFKDTTFSIRGVGLLLAALFAVFCYVLELERLGRMRLGPPA